MNGTNESIGRPASQPKINTFNIERTFKSRLHTIFAISYLIGTNRNKRNGQNRRTSAPMACFIFNFFSIFDFNKAIVTINGKMVYITRASTLTSILKV